MKKQENERKQHMSMKETPHIMPALLSILDRDENISKSGTEQYIQYLIDKGIRNFYINGTTGEAFALSLENRKKNLEIIKSVVTEDCFLMVQIGAISTKESILLAKHAEQIGVDAISAIMPFYFKFTWDEIVHHYHQIMDSVALPFCPYYIPHLSKVSVTRQNLEHILQHPQVKYLKYTSNDFYTLQKIKKNFPDTVIFNGFDEMLLSGIAAGADGGIGSTYNFTYDSAQSLLKHVAQGDLKNARRCQDEINSFVDMLLDVGQWQCMKYLLHTIGIQDDTVASPFLSISQKNKKKVDMFVTNNIGL